jgi:hypothetical protein
VTDAPNVPTDGKGGGALPEIISRYQDAHDRHDTAAALSAFAPDARVMDDGHEFRGSDQVGDWLAHASRAYTFTRTLVRAEETGTDTFLVVNHLEGNFPGGVVDLRYTFVLRGNLIAELVIAP